MNEPPIPVEVPLGQTAVAVLAGIVACPLPVASGALVAATTLLAWSRARPVALAFLTGLLLGAPLRHAALVRVPGIYAIEGTVVYDTPPRFGRRRVRMHIEQVEGIRLRTPALASIDVPAWADGPWVANTRISAVVLLRHRTAKGWIGHAPHARAITSVDPPPPASGLRKLRARAASQFDALLAPNDAGVLRAMVLGDRGGLAREDKRRFRDSGQAHLLAVSGLHVGLWIAATLLLLRLAQMGPRRQALIALGVLAVGVPLAGAPLSAVRAGCAGGLYFLARLCGRDPSSLVVLTVVALCVLLLSPHAAFDVAFRLSFSAVLGILLLSRPISWALIKPRTVIPGYVKAPRAAWRMSLAVSCAAWLGTLPFVLDAMGRVVPASPLVAVVAIPLTGVVLLAGFATLALGWIPLLSVPVVAFATASTHTLRGVLDLAVTHGVGPVFARPPAHLALAAYALSLCWLSRARLRSQAVRRFALVVGLVVAWLCFADPQSRNQRYDSEPMSSAPSALAVGHLDAAWLLPLAGGLLALGAFTVFARWLTRGGAACAVILGLLAGVAFGPAGVGALLAPFVVATLLGKLPRRKLQGHKLPGGRRSGARSARQVWSNGIPAAIGCALALSGFELTGFVFFLGGLACLGADTCATEIGVRYGGTARTLTGKRVALGESGGMTVLGTLASVAGSTLAPLGASVALGQLIPFEALCVVAAAGIAGGLLDSWLGATWQYRGRAEGSDLVIEEPTLDGVRTERVRGVRWLDNNQVNLVTGLASGLIAVALRHAGFML